MWEERIFGRTDQEQRTKPEHVSDLNDFSALIDVSGMKLSPEARPFTPGVSRHVVRPLSGDGVLAGDQCTSFEHLRTEAKITSCLEKWRLELETDIDRDYLLEGIEHGFHIIDIQCLPSNMSRANYKSTSGENKCKVEKRICEEIVKGNYLV
jgi:hypothetical protein